MGIIRFAIRYPITIAVGVILVTLFGLVFFLLFASSEKIFD